MRLWRMMSKSKVFLLGSLIFLLSNFIYLLYFEDKGNHSFTYDSFFTFEVLVKNTDKKLNGYNLLVEPQDLNNFSGNILVYTYLYPVYHYGDQLEISCKIYQPEPIVEEGSKTFAYDKYLAKDNIFGTCFRPRIKVVGQSKNLSYYIFQAKDYFWQNLNDYLVEPSSSLAKAMFLATRREIPAELRDMFARVGLSHMIAISGLHMAIIVWLMQSFLIAIGLSRKSSLWFLILLLVVYLYMIGFPSSAVRASLMVIILLLGPFLGRSTESIYSLILVADIFILFNPYLLLYDIGFQLSFLAVAGLLYYVKFFNKTLVFVPQQFKLREALSVTLAAQVFTWPLIVYNFGIFSLVAPLANFLVLPFLPAVLILAILVGLVGFWSALASLIAWPLFIILKIIVYVSELLSKIPYAFVYLDNFSLIYMLLALFFMIMITIILKPKSYET
jgi:competence protein ComEC